MSTNLRRRSPKCHREYVSEWVPKLVPSLLKLSDASRVPTQPTLTQERQERRGQARASAKQTQTICTSALAGILPENRQCCIDVHLPPSMPCQRQAGQPKCMSRSWCKFTVRCVGMANQITSRSLPISGPRTHAWWTPCAWPSRAQVRSNLNWHGPASQQSRSGS